MACVITTLDRIHAVVLMVTLEMESAAVVLNVLILQILNSASQILVQIILHEPLKAYKFQYLTKTFSADLFSGLLLTYPNTNLYHSVSQ